MPDKKVKETLPCTQSIRELEKTIKAMQAGNINKNVARVYGAKPILVNPKA